MYQLEKLQYVSRMSSDVAQYYATLRASSSKNGPFFSAYNFGRFPGELPAYNKVPCFDIDVRVFWRSVTYGFFFALLCSDTSWLRIFLGILLYRISMGGWNESIRIEYSIVNGGENFFLRKNLGI